MTALRRKSDICWTAGREGFKSRSTKLEMRDRYNVFQNVDAITFATETLMKCRVSNCAPSHEIGVVIWSSTRAHLPKIRFLERTTTNSYNRRNVCRTQNAIKIRIESGNAHCFKETPVVDGVVAAGEIEDV